MSRLRPIRTAALAVVLGLGLILLLVAFLNARDDAGVQHDAGAGRSAPGTAFAGAAALLGAGGLETLRAGNVVVLHGARTAPPALVRLRDELSGPPDPALARAGQAVLLEHRAGTRGVVALAWRRRLDAEEPADPRLAAFARYWLGRGAGGG